MAYAQWIEVQIEPANYMIQIRNASHSWGKFYWRGNKDDELSPGDIDKITLPANVDIAPRNPAYICACGRSSSPSGTEGSFEIWDGGTRVGVFSWDCPWGFGSNSFGFAPDPTSGSEYVTTVSGRNSGSRGPIGAVTIATKKNAQPS